MITAERPKIVSPAEWLAARQQHLRREKELTRLRDQLNAERRQLPWVKVEKPYRFDGLDGPQTLADLFAGRSQLIVYHFMLGPGWEEGCVSCSFLADHFDGARMHFEHHDVKFAVISRAPLAEIEAFRNRMGWRFKWVSSHTSDFNYDFHVSFTPEQMAGGKVYYNYAMGDPTMEELPGASVFYQDKTGAIFHTYSCYARGLDILVGAHNFLDLTPKGRAENSTMDWIRYHDRYEMSQSAHPGEESARAGQGIDPNPEKTLS